MNRYFVEHQMRSPQPKDLIASFKYFSFKDLDWFSSSLINQSSIYDYQLLKVEHCPTVTTATIKNTGFDSIPYSVTGYKDGQKIITQWYNGHRGRRSIQLFNEDYDEVVINDHLKHHEYNQKNNRYYPQRWILQRAEPLKFQFYNSFEKADASQVFYMPALNYNAYDKLLIGAIFSNASLLVQKPFEYTFSPEYSTGTGKLTGSASFTANYTTPKSHFFRQISFGAYGRYFHYDRDLAFFRFSPSLNLRIRKPYPKSPLIQSLRLRAVSLQRELPAGFEGVANSLSNASYTVLNANYRLENTNIFSPTILRVHTEFARRFGKVFIDYDKRWMLPNKRWLIWRNFGGAFFYNQLSDNNVNNNFYSFGLSGTPDYLFDYAFIGRSDQSGIWSRQFFTTDGGFKSETNVFADRFMLSSNLSLPIWSIFGVFGDAAFTEKDFYWDYGIRIAIFTDFLEFYLPLQNHERRFYEEAHYLQNLRFVMDIDLGNIFNRLRRGFY
jgi:hypothetical protein